MDDSNQPVVPNADQGAGDQGASPVPANDGGVGVPAPAAPADPAPEDTEAPAEPAAPAAPEAPAENGGDQPPVSPTNPM